MAKLSLKAIIDLVSQKQQAEALLSKINQQLAEYEHLFDEAVSDKPKACVAKVTKVQRTGTKKSNLKAKKRGPVPDGPTAREFIIGVIQANGGKASSTMIKDAWHKDNRKGSPYVVVNALKKKNIIVVVKDGSSHDGRVTSYTLPHDSTQSS